MSVKFEVKMTDKIMYDFMLHHNYTSVSGLLGAVIGCVALAFAVHDYVSGDAVWVMPMIFVAVVSLILPPISMRTKAKMQVMGTPAFRKPLTYELTEEGIWVRQEGLETLNAWEDITKAVSSNCSVILYLTRVRAVILPRSAMGDQYEKAMEMIHTHLSPNKVKIRY